MARRFNLVTAATAAGVGLVDELVQRNEKAIPNLGPLSSQETFRYAAAIGGQFFGGAMGEDVSIAAIPLATKSLMNRVPGIKASGWVPSRGAYARDMGGGGGTQGVNSEGGTYRPIS